MTATFLTARDVDWNLERAAFNLLIDQQPAALAVPQNADEVSDVVRSAAADGKRVAAQSTGHNAEPLGSLANTVLLRTSRLRDERSIPMPAKPGLVPAPSGVM
jgi:FAD/FMN-containing dehydrogenase